MLAIYFEEVAAHQHKMNKTHDTPSRDSEHSITDIEIGDEEDGE